MVQVLRSPKIQIQSIRVFRPGTGIRVHSQRIFFLGKWRRCLKEVSAFLNMLPVHQVCEESDYLCHAPSSAVARGLENTISTADLFHYIICIGIPTNEFYIVQSKKLAVGSSVLAGSISMTLCILLQKYTVCPPMPQLISARLEHLSLFALYAATGHGVAKRKPSSSE